MTTEQMDWLDDQRRQQEAASANVTPGDKTVPSKKKSKKRVSLKDIPMTRAQVVMREDILRPKSITEPQPPAVWREGKCRECGEQIFALEVAPSRYQWFHNRLGAHSPQDKHIGSFISAAAAIDEQEGTISIGTFVDSLLGDPPVGDWNREVAKIALEVIADGPRLELGLEQWSRVQALVESGVRAGVQAEQSGRL